MRRNLVFRLAIYGDFIDEYFDLVDENADWQLLDVHP